MILTIHNRVVFNILLTAWPSWTDRTVFQVLDQLLSKLSVNFPLSNIQYHMHKAKIDRTIIEEANREAMTTVVLPLSKTYWPLLLWNHMALVSSSTETIHFEEQRTQPSESLTSVIAFDFDIEGQQCQATGQKRRHKFKTSILHLVKNLSNVLLLQCLWLSTVNGTEDKFNI